MTPSRFLFFGACQAPPAGPKAPSVKTIRLFQEKVEIAEGLCKMAAYEASWKALVRAWRNP